jgi:hypothetical protein
MLGNKTCLLAATIALAAHPFDSQILGKRLLEMLEASNVDVAEYLAFERQNYPEGLLRLLDLTDGTKDGLIFLINEWSSWTSTKNTRSHSPGIGGWILNKKLLQSSRSSDTLDEQNIS